MEINIISKQSSIKRGNFRGIINAVKNLISHVLCIFVQDCTLFIVLLYIIISQRFSFYTSTFSIAYCHPFPVASNMMIGFAFLSLYVTLLYTHLSLYVTLLHIQSHIVPCYW